MATFALSMILAWSLAVLTHGWPRFSAAVRHRLAITMNLGAIVSLVAALRAEGLRETAMTSYLLMGTGYRTAVSSAAASYYYYVLTVTCLLLGFAGVAFAAPLARFLSARPLLNAACIAWLVTLVRFLLEKSAAPSLLVQAVGVTWMAPIAGASFALTLPTGNGFWRPLLRDLAAYALLARAPITLLGVLATRFQLGTHYDVSGVTSVSLGPAGLALSVAPGSLDQMLLLTIVPQLLAWTTFTVVAGALGALIAWRFRQSRSAQRPNLPAAAALSSGQ